MRTRELLLSGGDDVAGPVHLADFGGAGTPIVLVHGLGGSHVNWVTVGEALSRHGHVTAPDLIGHGRTPPAGRTSNVRSNRDLVRAYLRQEVGDPAILVGNSMGGFLSMLTAAASPEQVAGLVLVGPAVPGRVRARTDATVAALFGLYALPGIAEPMMRMRSRWLGPEGLVRQTLELCTVDVDRIPRSAYQAHVEMARERFEMPWSRRSFLSAARSLLSVLVRPGKVDPIIRRIDAPGLIVQGERDRLVRVESIERLARLRPDWELARLDDLGHVPQLEDPDRFLAVVEPWLRATDEQRRASSVPA